MTLEAFFFLKANLDEPTRSTRAAWKFTFIVDCSRIYSAFCVGNFTAYCCDVSFPTNSSCSCWKKACLRISLSWLTRTPPFFWSMLPSAREDWLARPGFPMLGLSMLPSIRLLRGKREFVFMRSRLDEIRGEDPIALPDVASVAPYVEEDCSWACLYRCAC